MATINFLLQSDSETAGIYVRLKEGRTIDIKAKTKFAINSKEWSKAKGWIKSVKDSEQKVLANNLEKLKTDLLNHYNGSSNKLEINTQWLKDFISPRVLKDAAPGDLLPYFDYYFKVKKQELKKASQTKLNVVKELVKRFEAANKSTFKLKDVDGEFKNKFVSYSASQGYAPNTTARNFKFIKTVCYHAEANGLEISSQLKHITMKNTKVEKIFLNLEDLMLVEKCKYAAEHLDNARDWLLISCETGQRVSDFLRFSKEMIRSENGKKLIEFTQVKTGKIMTVPLSKKVQAILKKRKGNFPPKMSDQRYNEHIKTVCKLAEITYKIKGSIIDPDTLRKVTGMFEKWQLVSWHIGRRSFASNNYGRIPTSLLIAATGHSTETMFLEYIGKTDTQKALQLAEYF